MKAPYEGGFTLPLALASELWVPACSLQMTFPEKNTTTVGSKYAPADCFYSLNQDLLLHVFSNAIFLGTLSLIF